LRLRRGEESFELGQLVTVQDQRGQTLGTAYINPSTLIAARLLSRQDETIDVDWFAAKLRRALTWRERLYRSPHYRWVYGESDGLPGLVLDRFGDVVVGQLTTAGMNLQQRVIEEAIRRVLNPRVLLWKNDGGARALEGLPEDVCAAWGEPPGRVEVIESAADGGQVVFETELGDGQKTGWFYDQAFNRSQLARFMKTDARVLDVCCYAGGWAATAASLGARRVDCVDASAPAIERAQANVARQARAGATAEFFAHRGDAFDVLAQLAETGERYDVVVVDPPAFIKRRKDIPQGEAAYRKLNQLALRVLADEGLLISCSCSYHLAIDSLQTAIQSAARHVDRSVQIVYQGMQSPDHPVHPAIPETRYLKAFFCRVTRG
jgi:23S rRNA (cytosine1962-C5)-methyltransferase